MARSIHRTKLVLAATAVLAGLVGAVSCTTSMRKTASPGATKGWGGTPEPIVTSNDERMNWWRDARFGMFIHWGLYSIPAGQWEGRTDHGEWIMNTAHIPVPEYEKFKDRFNPVKFDADAWVRMAKAAGMKYVVITTKHHDGFCLFDSKYTEYDVMSTPFHRDIMKEMAAACRRNGMQICWYHSIMDWHHPDYTPRRDWETRSTQGADFDRYNAYLKNQVGELLTNYGPIGVMWFDGQWEGTWTHERGLDLYANVRKLQPHVIINNRVDKGGGSFGMTKPGYVGDYGTPEQEIPPTGVPNVDWETCMTMNDHWGYNSHDHNFKSTEDLVRKLADIAGKGGNFLLNVGPTSEGLIPPESVQRLGEIAQWMHVNGDSIHGTQAGPFKNLTWGRCTQRPIESGGTRLYLHVFNWPADGRLVVGGLFNDARSSGPFALSDPSHRKLAATRDGDALVIEVPKGPFDPIDTVIALDVDGKPDVADPPSIDAYADMFVGSTEASLSSDRQNVQLRYTTDNADPGPFSTQARGPIHIEQTTTISARAFRNDRAVSPVSRRTFIKVAPKPAAKIDDAVPGIAYEYYEGDWNALPDFDTLKAKRTGIAKAFDRQPHDKPDRFGFRYKALVSIPADGVYTFWTNSDDGSRLYIGDELVVENDGLHSARDRSGTVALAKGLHPITVTYFEKGGGHELEVFMSGPGMSRNPLDGSSLVVSRPSGG
jgi:alpha-L-fucosidase